jgi:triacylglycerol lipase
MSTVDDRTALFLAAACAQTYRQFERPDGAFVVPQGYRRLATVTARLFGFVRERFGFILESDRHVLIAFRGTTSGADAISDMIARQTPFRFVSGAGDTHRGFTSIYGSTRKQLLDILKHLSPSKKLLITGHSLGGALATLCALDMAVHSPFKHPIVCTYGAPRVGNPAFASAFNRTVANSRRIFIEDDVVPKLPPVLYTSPRTKKIYVYQHVKHGDALPLRGGSASVNHALGSYFAELSRRDPQYAETLCSENPGFCPE